MANVIPNPSPTVAPLTTPCTVTQLRNWLKGVDGLLVGNNTATVAATATTIGFS